VPVITFRVPGLMDSVEDGKTGILVDFGDFKAMGKAASRVARDRGEWERLSKGAVERAKAYGWDVCCAEFKGILGSVRRRSG